MPINVPCYYARHYAEITIHYARHYAEIAIGTGHAKGDFRCVRHWHGRWNEVRQFVHGPGEIVQPAMRVAGGEFRVRMSGESCHSRGTESVNVISCRSNSPMPIICRHPGS